MTGVRIGVVGGSIAGCATGVSLARAGFSVTILERSSRRLEERGSGIVLPRATVDLLKERELVDPDFAGLPLDAWEWRSRDGGHTGRVAFRQPLGGEAHHWGSVYRQFRKRVPEELYRAGSTVVSVAEPPGGNVVDVICEDGERFEFDVLVGADGYRSTIRGLVKSAGEPQYAGYPAWRGLVDEKDIDHAALAERTVQMVGVPHGQMAVYMVPGPDGDMRRGHRQLNWLIYDSTVPLDLVRSPDDGSGRVVVDAVAPGRLSAAQLRHLYELGDQHLPPWHRQIVLRTPQPYLQALHDLTLDSYTEGRTCLVGDAATIARPHTASGTSKAIQDSLALCDALQSAVSAEAGLASYHEARSAAGNALVRLGQDLGDEQVVHAPDWDALDADGYQALISGGAGGRTHFARKEPADPAHPSRTSPETLPTARPTKEHADR